MSKDEKDLNARYLELLRRCDGQAVRNKRWLFGLWGASWLLTWVPLMVVLVGLSGWVPGGFDPGHLMTLLRAAGLALSGVTILQFVFLFRGRWLKYRAGTERLRENCMRFRARLDPFNDARAEERFRRALDELEEEVGARKPFRLRDLIPWGYLIGLKPLPETLRVDFPHAPDQGPEPRWGDDLAAAEAMILEQRLRNQQRWHLVKAGTYSRRYLALQAGVVLLGLAPTLYGWIVGPTLGPMLLFSVGNLALVAWRDQMGYPSLCLRYTRIAEALGEIEASYRQRKATPDSTPEQHLHWLRQAAARGERTLASEFQYWYFGHGNFGAASSS